jgi:eukaryotic-like serine/threonine-protein kinase
MPVCPKCNTVYDGELKFCRTDGTPLIPLSSETHLPIGVVVNESLRVVDRLRTDRFGVVYRVEDAIDSGQTFALRLFRRGLVNSRVFAALGKLADRLRDELDEPDILTDYIPIQLEDGRYALLSRDFPGAVLDTLIVNEAPLKPPFVVATLLRIADVLAAAHRAKLVHGNVTPENVVVIDRNERGLTVKLADFGVASTIRQHNARALTAPPELVRLQNYDNYYAPEIVTGRGVEADVRTDVFSLGALCYQMLSGWIPFTEAAIEGDTAVYLTRDPRPLMVLNKELGIPEALERTMLKALDLDPEARYASLAELIEELQEIELDLSILPPPGGGRRAGSARLVDSGFLSDGEPATGRTTDPLVRTTGESDREPEPEPDDDPDAPSHFGG